MEKKQPPRPIETPVGTPAKASEKDPMNAVFAQSREQYYRSHGVLFDTDVKNACRSHNFEEVEQLFNDMGRFLLRHPDSLTMISPAPGKTQE